eukprot:1960539-Amphidinium_carterae.1
MQAFSKRVSRHELQSSFTVGAFGTLRGNSSCSAMCHCARVFDASCVRATRRPPQRAGGGAAGARMISEVFF